MRTHDVIVIGTGAVGSAALYCLARRGKRVLGIDRYPPGHDRGSSHGETRVIRKAYFEHPDYVPLLLAAYDRWRELESAVGQRLLHQVGLVEIGPPDGVLIGGVTESAERHGLDVDFLSAEVVANEFPQFRCPDACVAVVERDAGYLTVERCVVEQVRLAVELGAEHVVGEEVKSWSARNGSVEVRTDRRTYRAGALVVTAGAWSSRLLGGLGIPLRVLRKHLHWFATGSPGFRAPGCPTFFFELPDGFYYGFPAIDSSSVKVGEHSGGTPIEDPGGDDRLPEPGDVRRVERFVESCLVGVTTTRVRHTVCHYTMSPDEHFILDRHPEHIQVAFAAGLSGHGFKVSNVLGEALADLTLDGSTSLPVGFLNCRRPSLLS